MCVDMCYMYVMCRNVAVCVYVGRCVLRVSGCRCR